jgi:hypothetical protein
MNIQMNELHGIGIHDKRHVLPTKKRMIHTNLKSIQIKIWPFLSNVTSMCVQKWLILGSPKSKNQVAHAPTRPRIKVWLTLLEILSYATTMFATGMQLPVACNYARFLMQLQWIFATFLGVYATMVQLWSPSSQPLDDLCDISSYIFDMHILIVACATKIGQLWSFGKLGTHFL